MRDTLAHQFLEQSLILSFDQMYQPSQKASKTAAKTTSDWNFGLFHTTACDILSLEGLYLKYAF